MRCSFSFFDHPSGRGVVLAPASESPPGPFAAVDEARDYGRATADLEAIRATSFVLKSDDGVVSEHWVRSERDPAVWTLTPPDEDLEEEDEPENGGEAW